MPGGPRIARDAKPEEEAPRAIDAKSEARAVSEPPRAPETAVVDVVDSHVIRPPAATPRAAALDGLGAYYGYQGLLLRLGGVGLVALGGLLGQVEALAVFLSVSGLAVYVVGPLVVHAAHGRFDNLLYSLGSTVLLTGLGIVVGIGATPDDAGGLAPIAGGVIGGLIGNGLGAVLDATVFGFERAPAEPGEGVALAPTVVRALDGSTSAGLGLVF